MNRFCPFIFRIVVALLLVDSWFLTAEPVGKEGATAVANGWLSDEVPHSAGKLRGRFKSVETHPGFHVVHLQPEGFIITSDDDELEPVLAFSDRGEFKYDPSSPLCILLNRDATTRTGHLQRVKKLRANPSASTSSTAVGTSSADDDLLNEAAQARKKWDQFKSLGSRLAPSPHAALASMRLSGAVLTNAIRARTITASDSPVRILDLRVVDDRVQLTHDSQGSVTIYSSSDGGQTWQIEDTAIVWPTWTAKRSIQETGSWFRVVNDQLIDAPTVALMRHPPPLTLAANAMTNLANVSEPTKTGLSRSAVSVSDIRVAPLVQSAWNQGSERGFNCYNYFTPNNYVDGCVATALGQLMRYWQYPSAGIGRVTRTVYVNGTPQSATTRGGDGSGGAYNWSAMPLIPSTATYNASQWQMIGSLCFDAGVSVNMQYAGSGSGAYMYLCASALSSVFKYSNAKYVNSPGNILLPTDSNLAAGCPVLFGISASGQNGHAVVCDGFGYESGTLYHHINFGWAGSYNAWYAFPNLETPYAFNSIDTIIFNVFPSGTGELLTGRVLTTQGAPVTGAGIVAAGGGGNYSATTDSKGYYGIKVPSARTYTVTASKTGMTTVTRSATTGTTSTSASGNVMDVDFTLNNNFSFTAIGLTNSVWLRWSAPTNSGLPNNTVYVRTRTDRYPTNSTDGSLVYSGTSQAYEHTGVDASGSVTNYYTIWGDNGSSYVSLGSSANAATVADPGLARLLWIRITGEVLSWNLKTNGVQKSGGFAYSGLINTAVWKISGFGDIDRDGVPDILWTRTTGEVIYWMMNADGTMKSSGSVVAGNATRSGYYTVAAFKDIDGDGTADVLWTGGGGQVSYWLLNPDGTLKSGGLVTAGNATRSGYFKVGGFSDIDRDGVPDILWVGNGGEVGYYMLKADGTLKSAGAVATGNSTRSGYYTAAGFSDIDRDGTADILWSGAGGEVGYWLLNPNGTKKSAGTVATPTTPAGYWSVRGFTDINRDGTADIIWLGNSGETLCWMLNSNGTFRSSITIQPALVSKVNWTLSGVSSLAP